LAGLVGEDEFGPLPVDQRRRAVPRTAAWRSGAPVRVGGVWVMGRPAAGCVVDRACLAGQCAGGVGEFESLAQGAGPWGDLNVSVARQVGEQVVFDLVAQVADHEVE
jgi:hypothetical protein